MKKVTVINTVPMAVEPIARLINRVIPEVRVVSMLDDSLLRDVISAGHLTVDVTKRVVQYSIIAEEAGSDFVLNACSSIGETVKAAAQVVKIPVARIDLGMAEKAVEVGSRIGVLATLKTTIEPTSSLVSEVAADKDKEVTIVSRVCEGAFEKLGAGKVDEHDEMVAKAIKEMADEVEVIVLAQASMARALDSLKVQPAIPVLTSPELGIAKVRQLMGFD